MSAKQGSNKGIYIFWISILLVVVAVVLFFVIPRTDYSLPYNNFVAVSKNTNQEDFYDKTFADYVSQIRIDYASNLTTENINKINNLTKIQDTLFLSNNFNNTALTFLKKSSNFKSFCDKQTSAKNSLNKEINEFQSYCKTTLKSFMNQSGLSNQTINEIVGVMINNYFNLTSKYINFYEKSALVIENCSQQGIMLTSTIIDNHKSIILQLKTQFQNETLDTTSINSIYSTAITFY